MSLQAAGADFAQGSDNSAEANENLAMAAQKNVITPVSVLAAEPRGSRCAEGGGRRAGTSAFWPLAAKNLLDAISANSCMLLLLLNIADEGNYRLSSGRAATVSSCAAAT